MDIIQELRLIKEKDYEQVYDQTMEQIDIFKKKLHLIKVVKLVNEIEKSFSDDSLKKLGVVSLVFKQNHKEHYYYTLEAFDEDDSIVQRITVSGLTRPAFQGISNSLTDLSGFDNQHTGKDKSVTLILGQDNVREKLLGMLLSSELKKILDYSEMQLEIINNELTENSKKLKI